MTMDVELESVVCLGAILENPSGMPVRSYGPFLSFGQFFIRSLKNMPSQPLPVDGLIVPVVIGADLFIRRDIIEREGFFDPVFLCIMKKTICREGMQMLVVSVRL